MTPLDHGYSIERNENGIFPAIYASQDAGYSIEMKEKSVNTFSFPNGEYWIRNT